MLTTGSKRRCVAVALALVLPAGGCGLDLGYLIPAAIGQTAVLNGSVPVSQAIRSGGLTEEQVAKLELIRDVRVYARDVIGLDVGAHYAMFYDAGDEAVLFNISASRQDAFEPKVWTFPIVGTVPYLGYFYRSGAEAKFAKLEAEGLDVFMYEVDAYSGLDFFSNVILSPILDRSDVSLADTVIHELLHSTVWRANGTSFNESLATFMGRTGAMAYFADRYPDAPELVQAAVERFEDVDRYSDFALSLFNELDAFYTSGLAAEDRIAGREAVYQAGRDRFVAEVQPLMNHPTRYDWVQNLPTNNAWMLSIRRYNLDLDVFEQVHAATGGDFAASLSLFRAAAADPDPYGFLQAWLARSIVARADSLRGCGKRGQAPRRGRFLVA